MTDEAAFLAQLADHPADDITRLVYADWLEEQGDERGAYLRAEQELAALGEDDSRYAELDRGVSEWARTLQAEWLAAAGKRWDVWLIGYPPMVKISVIKVLRELLNCGLADAKTISESLPAPILVKLSRVNADAVRAMLQAAKNPSYHHPDLPDVTVALRPWTEQSDEMLVPIPPYFQIVLNSYLPRRKTAAIRALCEVFQVTPSEARGWLEECLPMPYGRFHSEEIVLNLIDRLSDSVVAEMVRHNPGPIPRRPVTPRLPAPSTSAPYTVRLISYPPTSKIAVIKAIRDLTGVGLGEAKAHSERPFPITLRENCSRDEAERIATIFAPLGPVEFVGTTPSP